MKQFQIHLRSCAFEITLKHLYQGWNTGSAEKKKVINHFSITYNDQYRMLFCSISFRTVSFQLQVMPLKWVVKSMKGDFKIREKIPQRTAQRLVSVYTWMCTVCVLGCNSFEKYAASAECDFPIKLHTHIHTHTMSLLNEQFSVLLLWSLKHV